MYSHNHTYMTKKKLEIRRTLGYYWPHMKRYPKSHIVTFVAFGLSLVGTEVVTPLIYKNIIDTVSGVNTPSTQAEPLFFLLFLLAITLALYNIFFRIGDYAVAYFQVNVLRDIGNFTFSKVHNHSRTFFANNFAGAISTKSYRFINAFETLHDKLVYHFFFGGLSLIASIVVMFWFIPPVALLFVAWLILYVALVIWFTKKKIPLDLAEAQANSAVGAQYIDSLTNVLNVKMFAAKRAEFKRFKKMTDDEARKSLRAWYFDNFQKLVQGALFSFLEFGVMYLVIVLWLKGDISSGTIVLVQIYLFSAFGIIWNIGRTLTESAKALANAKEMVDIFEKPLGIKDTPSPEVCHIGTGVVEIEKIDFHYDDNDPILENFSLTIQAGEKVGLIGHSGAGKSTIVQLLLRFSDVRAGKIMIDGQDIRNITQDDLRKNIAYVPQDPILFHRSLRENIAYGNPDATDDEIIAAATKAHAHEFITSLPDGYDTLVGERGIKLSGGERQRVAIARAMIKDAPILILDEATSALDSVSEMYIQAAFRELMKDRTTLVIAHRLSTIQKMDRIIVLKDGIIAEEGTHDELVLKNGIYNTFWTQQAGQFIAD